MGEASTLDPRVGAERQWAWPGTVVSQFQTLGTAAGGTPGGRNHSCVQEPQPISVGGILWGSCWQSLHMPTCEGCWGCPALLSPVGCDPW